MMLMSIDGRVLVILTCLLILVSYSSCQKQGDQNSGTSQIAEGKTKYARGFRIEEARGYKILHVVNPWQGSMGIHLQYILAEDPSRIPDSIKLHPVIRIPVKRVVCMSTTHVAMIDAIGESDAIVGISGSD